MEEQFIKKEGLYVSECLGDKYPDVYMTRLHDERDQAVKSATAFVFNDMVIELYKSFGKGEELVDSDDVPPYEIIETDFVSNKKRYYKVVLANEEDVKKGCEA